MSTKPVVTASVGNAPNAEFNNVRINGTLSVARLQPQLMGTNAGAASLAPTGDYALRAQQVLGGKIVVHGMTADHNFNLPTAATISANWPTGSGTMKLYDVIPLTIANNSTSVATLVAGTNFTLDTAGGGIGSATCKELLITCTNATTPVFYLYSA